MNVTLDGISDPDELEYWILIVIDYLSFLHRNLHIVNLDIKPNNIFLGRIIAAKNFSVNDERGNHSIYMDMGSALTIDIEGDR
jgi:serine/threonine protein kinase